MASHASQGLDEGAGLETERVGGTALNEQGRTGQTGQGEGLAMVEKRGVAMLAAKARQRDFQSEQWRQGSASVSARKVWGRW